ncbi:hypothetical protein M2401_000833 [Pseudomonas sp. JUb42]|uniref:hypothetical protein n=1 Tax=Pseudomonas sp. JUb42 TaxID=2940611 RepID=UPI0021692592|nr:hypothetical protein [Pseudomonas sp. JUb42]MCS3467112.1 hypothetical protein [Pseudomonas sp. JUb42]
MALVPVAIGAMVGWYLLAPEPSLDRICARNNERGSSAWVACVDRMIQERK